jgi:alpha-N-arabinofuranosidase
MEPVSIQQAVILKGVSMNPFRSRIFSALVVSAGLLAGSASAAEPAPLPAQLTLRADQGKSVINPNIYGQFAEHLGHGIYGGIWVGEDSKIPNIRGFRKDVVEALKKMRVPVLRWPGGCFADEYHWKDGIGPREKRPRMINTNWGGVTEDNAFGTHEFMDFCDLIGAEPYINGNLGSGTPQEMMEWVEYLTSDAQSPMADMRRKNGREKPWKVKYFGIGNEAWGCGGNMRPEYYSDNFRRYSTFLKSYAGNQLLRIAVGPSGDDYRWTDVLMKNAGPMYGLSLHNYTIPTGNWDKKGPATQFTEAAWHSTLRGAVQMNELITKHSAIMNVTDPEKKVGLIVDEWGIWTDPQPGTNPGFLIQQNTLRDALLAALHFHVFQDHSDRVPMANIAQMINVLQAMILTDGDKMLLTPTYHIFEMFNVHQGAVHLPIDVKAEDYVLDGKRLPSISANASKAANGTIHLSLVNTRPDKAETVTCDLLGMQAKNVTGRILTASAIDAHNTFEQPENVKPKAFDGAKLRKDKLEVTLPAKSVVVLELK